MLNKKVDLKQMDKIILHENDITTIENKIKAYIDDNPILRSKVQEVPLKISSKGTYELTFGLDEEQFKGALKFLGNGANNSKTYKALYYYDIENKGIKIGELDESGNFNYIVNFDDEVNHISIQIFSSTHKKHSKIFGDEQLVSACKSALAQIMNFMIYSQLMTFLNEENSLIKKQTLIKGFSSEKKLTKKEREREERKRVSISRPKVNYDYEEAQREGYTRSYGRVAESWEVEGHWRTYKKSGKRVFVKGYKKGSGNASRKGKDFTI